MTSHTSKGDETAVRSRAEEVVAPRFADHHAWVLVGVALPVVAGLVSGWLMPRGPLTAGQALVGMGVALATGAAAGFAWGNRWGILGVPLAYLIVFELARTHVVGPTVQGVHLFSGVYGVLAFALGHVFPAVLSCAPLLVGAVYGTVLAGQLRGLPGAPVGLGWMVVAPALTVLLALLAGAIARPAATSSIVGQGGDPVAGSVAELTHVIIGGREQALMIRSRSVENPVLLYLAGGPGGTDMGAMRADVTLEQYFTVVVWDQRGAGKSYAALDPTSAVTVDRLVADAVEVTDYLRTRFAQERVYLVGQSWGSLLGALAVQSRPDLYHAFVGVGQMVSPTATDVVFWEDALAWAESEGNVRLAGRLRRNGPPPYQDLLAYDPVVAHEHDWNAYPGFDGSNEMPATLFVPEYDFMDRVNAFRGFLDSAAILYPQLQGLDLRLSAAQLAVPVTVVIGEYEARGRREPALEWFERLEAPTKDLIVVAGAGHRANFDDPAGFARVMRGVAGGEP